ncbi:ubiquitin-conjugating enzyme E2 variant 3 [Tachysurus fulvidraco]|uniref:ubiquitin-conjugating enzyme E2 variant 3 n=1 Tax=Tachysurus fulvidraco TaxID=1234273 RepID=UPI000F5012F9|nr:ubiquitin-conjugating enzyme E2 variant 3 [Tachysurus fulvidraco]
MDLNQESVKKILFKYKFHDVAIEELQKIQVKYPDMKTVTGTYTFTDSSQKELLKLLGNIPVKYQGHSYNLPIQLWLLDSFPFTPPICLLRPTANMVIREGKHVDAKGRIYLPALHNWDHPKSSVIVLLEEMIAKFEEDPPLATKSTGNEKDPNELLAMVSHLNITEGGSQPEQSINKISVIGGGDLGMAAVLSIMAKGFVDKLVLIDIPESSTKGGTMDLELFSLPKVEVSKDLSASAGSKVVVVTANAWNNEQSFVSVVQTNVDLYGKIISSLTRLSPNAVLLIASQPVEIMTHVAWRQSRLPPTHVIGVGCNLESERLSYILNVAILANSTNKKAWVIGEQTGNKAAVWANVSGDKHQVLVPASKSTRPLIDRAFEILKGKGQRSWSVGLSIADITHSILTDQHKTHSITTLAQGWGGIGSEVFLSLPCVLGTNGSTRLAGVTLSTEDDAKLKESVSSLNNLITQLRI